MRRRARDVEPSGRERVYGLLLSATGLAVAQSYVTRTQYLKDAPLSPSAVQVWTVGLIAFFFILGLLLYTRFGIRGGSSH